MKPKLFPPLILLAGLLATVSCTVLDPVASGQKLTYPQARRVEQLDDYHGVQVADPYRWMEDLESEELHSWMKAQDALLDGFFADPSLVEQLEKRIAEISTFAARGLPTRKGKKTFYVERESGETYGRLYVEQDGAEKPRQLLDLAALNQDGKSASATSYSPQGSWITVSQAQNQSRWQQVRLLRVEDGKLLEQAMSGFYSGRSTIAWLADESGFFYVRYAVPDDPQAPLGEGKIYFHLIGTPQSEDKIVHERPQDAGLSYALRVSHDGRYLILNASQSAGTFNGMYDRIFYKDLKARGATVTELLPGVQGTHAFEGSQGKRFFIRTTNAAPQARVVEVDLSRPQPTHWKEIIPEAEEPIQAVSEIGQRLVVQYIKDGRTVARIFDFQGGLHKEIDHLAPSMTGFADDRTSSETFYGTSTLHDPAKVYRLDVATGQETLHYRPQLAYRPDDFKLDQVFLQSKDGTRVPMFLAYKKGIKLDGGNPVFMYGYGAWAWSAFPWQTHMIAWMERGGIYAVPNIRGGGEYGEPWHQAGSRRNKQAGIDDFIAAAEYLIENGYTSSAKLVANGGSASGIMPAAAAIQRPGLFGATVINFPALDQLRYQHFGSANSWIPEFGVADDPDDFKALYAYSPYHNLKEGACYPPTWIQVGEKDNTTTPMHGYKFAAALQAWQGCANPVLLKISWGAGHSYGATPEQSRRAQAEELAFLIQALKLEGG